MSESKSLVIGTCRCGGYGQVHDEETERKTGRCHVPIGDIRSTQFTPSLRAIQAAVLILPCKEGRTVGTGVEFDSTIQHAPTCPAHYITATAHAFDAAYAAPHREGDEDG